jgi:hypothetical protein
MSKMEQTKIGMLVGSNGIVAAMNPLVGELGSLLVMLGQVAVAVVTVIYVWKKIKAMGTKPSTKKSPK